MPPALRRPPADTALAAALRHADADAATSALATGANPNLVVVCENPWGKPAHVEMTALLAALIQGARGVALALAGAGASPYHGTIGALDTPLTKPWRVALETGAVEVFEALWRQHSNLGVPNQRHPPGAHPWELLLERGNHALLERIARFVGPQAGAHRLPNLTALAISRRLAPLGASVALAEALRPHAPSRARFIAAVARGAAHTTSPSADCLLDWAVAQGATLTTPDPTAFPPQSPAIVALASRPTPKDSHFAHWVATYGRKASPEIFRASVEHALRAGHASPLQRWALAGHPPAPNDGGVEHPIVHRAVEAAVRVSCTHPERARVLLAGALSLGFSATALDWSEATPLHAWARAASLLPLSPVLTGLARQLFAAGVNPEQRDRTRQTAREILPETHRAGFDRAWRDWNQNSRVQ